MVAVTSGLHPPHEHMVTRVAKALGPELAARMAFVGGCATALLVTDELIKTTVRLTDDVDVIVHVMGYGDWHQLEMRLAERGFRSSLEEEGVTCRKLLRDDEPGELIVDFMPDDHRILGFSNRWYTQALESATEHELADGFRVRVVSAPYFLATKLEAFKGRGNNDPIGSRDVEDILNLVEGRPTLIEEVGSSSRELRLGVAGDMAALTRARDFDYAVGSVCNGNRDRERQIFERLATLASVTD